MDVVTTYEYDKVVRVVFKNINEEIEFLNDRGNGRWQLCSVEREQNENGWDKINYYFKREKEKKIERHFWASVWKSILVN